MDDDALVRHQLFGGAIALDFPARFDDISEHRPVPDSQEVCQTPRARNKTRSAGARPAQPTHSARAPPRRRRSLPTPPATNRSSSRSW
jgi:hypothetical protein